MAHLGTRKLTISVDSTDFSDSVSSAIVSSGEKDSDFMSFTEALAGGAREYTLKLTLAQDTSSTSLWYYAWSQAGSDVDVEIWPYGGTTPSASTPKIVGTVTITEPDGDFIGGEANKSTSAVWVSEVEWVFTAKPTMAIA